MTDFKQNEFGQYREEAPKHSNNVLVGEFARFLNESLIKNYYKQSKDSGLLYNNSQKKSFDDFNRAKERIKQQIINADNSQDNSLVYTAMTQFKKRKE